MHSVALDSSGSPRKRTISRGMSEDESLRSIIKETESSSRRLTRSDSRGDTLKRRSDSQHSEQDLFMGLPEMMELQASYDEVVQELHGLEVERETLLFQVDVLQDTLEGVEELLAEAQREAGEANLELEREREAKRKLESMVCSLIREVERLKEERDGKPVVPVNTLFGEHARQDEVMRQGQQMRSVAKCVKAAHRDEIDSSLSEDLSSESRSRALPASEEVGQGEGAKDEGSPLKKLQKMVSNTLSHVPTLALDNPISQDGVLRRPYESHNERDLSPDRNDDSDSVSAYEDADAETPELDMIFPGVTDTLELPDDSSITADTEGNPTNSCQNNEVEARDPRNPDLCLVS
ncbi:hypothetical protein LDENG_00066500 [Lucifuga dentata]|nr:hypothetical protein LDENG_00066500 [Lucifuga dentata]